MAWNQDGRTGDKRTQAAQMAKDDIEKSWGGTAYTRVIKKRTGRGDLIADLGVQVALVEQENYHWTVSVFNPWVTEDGKLMRNGGSGVGKGLATEADATSVAKALIKINWS